MKPSAAGKRARLVIVPPKPLPPLRGICSTCHPSRRRPRAPGYFDCAECIADHAASLALAPETVRPS
jgi:hypothetical protein